MSLHSRQLGGLAVSALGLGCGTMSGLYGAGWREDASSEAVLGRALDLGVTLFDTADSYGAGHNEMLVGRGLRGRRHEAVIATKVGFQRGLDAGDLGFSGRPEYIKRACVMSLRRLAIETIDLYYLHRVDRAVPIEESVGAMAELVREGKVRHLGLSEASAATLRRACAVHPITALQSEYSLWTREPEREVLAACRELGIGFVPFSPLGRGFLTGTVQSSNDFAADDFRRVIPRFQEANLQQNRGWMDQLTALARERGCTPAQLALAWLLAQGDHIVPIPGTRNLGRLEENLGALQIQLSPAQAAAVAAIVPTQVAGPRYAAYQAGFVDS